MSNKVNYSLTLEIKRYSGVHLSCLWYTLSVTVILFNTVPPEAYDITYIAISVFDCLNYEMFEYFNYVLMSLV